MTDIVERVQSAADKVSKLKSAVDAKIVAPSIKLEMNLKIELDFVRTIRDLMNDAESALLSTARDMGCHDILVPPYVLDDNQGIIHHDTLSSILLKE